MTYRQPYECRAACEELNEKDSSIINTEPMFGLLHSIYCMYTTLLSVIHIFKPEDGPRESKHGALINTKCFDGYNLCSYHTITHRDIHFQDGACVTSFTHYLARRTVLE
jgi:hypothetical protein